MLDVKSSTPLYVQLMEKLEQKIRKGIYAEGERLLSEVEMAKSYDVSVITVRKAFSGLVKKGLIEKQQGKGTFVSKRRYYKDMNMLISFSDMCRKIGIIPGGKMMENRLVHADEKMAEKLHIKPNEKVISIVRVRLADGEPVAIERNYFTIKYAVLINEVFDNNSLFEFLKEKMDVTVSYSERSVDIHCANKTEAGLLKTNEKAPMLHIESVAYDSMKEPVYVGEQIINSDKFTLYL